MPQRYRMCIAYDGTEYGGWQIQPDTVTVQKKLEDVLARVTGSAPRVHGSGRTDQGVHAREQVAHFDLDESCDTLRLRRALNALLPPDIRVSRVSRAAHDFHARRSAVSKEYRYFIWNDEIVPPFLVRYRTPMKGEVDVDAMKSASACLTGRKDFAAFTANPNRKVESTVRNLTALNIRKRGREICICVECEGFLYKMVRSLAGYLMRVGQHAVSPDRTSGILASGTRTAVVPTAPPQGLFLWKVTY